MRRHIILRSPSTVGEGRNGVAASQRANSDEQLLKLWLHGRSPNTQRAYGSDASRLRSFVSKPLHTVRLADLIMRNPGGESRRRFDNRVVREA